jgi:hypothetical protein
MDILTIVLAAVAVFIIGFLAHGPVAGNLWMRLADIHPTGNEKLADMIPQMLWNLAANIVTAFVLSGVIYIAFTSPIMGEQTWYKGAIIGAWMWLGFIVPSSSMNVIWMGQKCSLWLFECASSLVAFLVMGAILAA